MERVLFALQRVTALALAIFVIVHIGVILYASQDGLSAAEILGRTRGHLGGAVFYGLFVVAAVIHAPIGLRNILLEWTRLNRRTTDLLIVVFTAMLLWLGARAVYAVFLL
jgi:fumarate reductase subunit C